MFVAQFLLAGESREIHGLLLGSTAYEDLHYVEAFLGLEFLELEHTNYSSFLIIKYIFYLILIWRKSKIILK